MLYTEPSLLPRLRHCMVHLHVLHAMIYELHWLLHFMLGQEVVGGQRFQGGTPRKLFLELGILPGRRGAICCAFCRTDKIEASDFGSLRRL